MPALYGRKQFIRNHKKSMEVFHDTFFAMGTRLDIVIPAVEREQCEEVYLHIRQEVERLEKKLSFFDTESDISLINREAVKKPLKVDKETFEILQQTLHYHSLTDGSFDVCKATLKYSGQEAVSGGVAEMLLDADELTVYFPSHLKIDLGGMGKGLALEAIKKMLLDAGIENALVCFGDSSILALGHHPSGNCWKVGIRSRVNPQTYLHHFELYNSSVSTSGNYYFNDEGTVSENNHIVDPSTNQLLQKKQLVSVVSPSPLEAEIASTALYVKSQTEAESILQNFEQMYCAYFELTDNTENIQIYGKAN